MPTQSGIERMTEPEESWGFPMKILLEDSAVPPIFAIVKEYTL